MTRNNSGAPAQKKSRQNPPATNRTDDKAASGAQLYRRLLACVWPYKAVFAAALFGMLAVSLSEAGFVAMLKPIMDDGFVGRDLNFIRWVPLILIVIALFRAFGQFLDTYCMRWVSRRVVCDLRQQMFEKLIRAPASYYDQNPSGGLIGRLTFNVEQIAKAGAEAVRTLFRDALKTVFLLAWMFYLSWKLSLMFIFLLPLAFWILRASGKRFRKISLRLQASVGNITHIAREAFQGHRVVKTFGAYAQESAEFLRANEQNRRQTMRRAAVASATAPTMMLIVSVGSAGIIWFALSQDISAGVFTSYLLAMTMLRRPLNGLSKVNEMIQTGLAGAQSVFEVLDMQAEEAGDEGRVLRDVTGHVAFKNVSFAYAELPVLHDISFDMPAGSTTALVGASGSGKSTLASLLLRFYQPHSGAIEIDGAPLAEINLASLREHIGLIAQEVVLFDQSIRRNIAYGTDKTDEDKMLRAAQSAQVSAFVDELPHGFDTQVGEQGALLSGGQRQRIAIARALYKDAPILILDEATSSLDSKSETEIRQAINNLIKDRTTLIIAHRLSTVQRADQILVLDNGRIVERGTHAELLQKDGAYKQLYDNQFDRESAADARRQQAMDAMQVAPAPPPAAPRKWTPLLAIQRGWRKPRLINYLLLPLGAFNATCMRFRAWLYRRGWRRSYALPAPVVVVGNLSVGGVGKTPLVIALCEALKKRGYSPGVVSRGYRGAGATPQIVGVHASAFEVGDEPLVIARRSDAPVAVDRNRVRAARLLLRETACDIIVSDDGFQHLRMRRDFDIVVIDERGFGNGWCLPAGPLRESRAALGRADALMLNGAPPRNLNATAAKPFVMQMQNATAYRLRAGLPDAPREQKPLADFKGKHVYAVAALGFAERFFRALAQVGMHVHRREFADHHAYSPDDFAFARAHDLIFMTEKDAVKCEHFDLPGEIWVAPTTAKLSDDFLQMLFAKVEKSAAKKPARR